MKVPALAAVLLCSLPAFAQNAQTGVSNPPADVQAPVQQAAPDPGYPAGYQPTPPPSPRRELTTETYGAYKPYRPAGTPLPAASDPDSTVVDGTVSGAPVATHTPARTVSTGISTNDADSLVVFHEPGRPNELSTGTMIHTRIRETLSTASSHPGDTWAAVVIVPVDLGGHILIPPGSTVDGRVTEVRPGHPVRGASALHLEPRRITLPDGTHYLIHAQVIESDRGVATRVDTEGTIYRRDKINRAAAKIGVSAGTGAVAGAAFGGGVGAIVGAGVGAGVGTAWWFKQDRQTVVPKDTTLVFSLNEPLAFNH